MDSTTSRIAAAKPPDCLRDLYKALQRSSNEMINQHPLIIDPASMEKLQQPRSSNTCQRDRLPEELEHIFNAFVHDQTLQDVNNPLEIHHYPLSFEVRFVPGLFVYPSLLPRPVQLRLLDRLLHRDLSDSEHNTNVHLHYHVSYPDPSEEPGASSFFHPNSSFLQFTPIDPSQHKAFSTQQFLNKKLRWMTLGGQYDWTAKLYPSSTPPPFPPDIKALIERLFPMKAEAAIVNLYSPGDTLSLHRDVSEECDQPLVSISLGCDGIFVVGLEGTNEDDSQKCAVLRLRSGDAVLMTGQSRYAWHAVPRVVGGTCPSWMEEWPYEPDRNGGGTRFEEWRGWMKEKRINLNVRQMFE